MTMPLVEIKSLTKRFSPGEIHAVEQVSFSIETGETLGLVGESGCGKTTLGRLILRLIEPTSGSIWFEGEEILQKSTEEMKAFRRKAQMVFQDPYASLNPRMRVGDIVAEPLQIHQLAQGEKRKERVSQLLEKVGLSPDAAHKFPHEFSGGQRQRIGIARAIAVEPKFIVADEPVSSLDVSVQAQIVNLLKDLQSETKMSYLFVSHDLKIVEFIAHRVAVMYLGRLMELLPAKDLTNQAQHPYTKALLAAVPVIDPDQKRTRIILKGDLPSSISPPSGCVFHTRCPLTNEQCRKEVPAVRALSNGHHVACHLV